MKLIDAREHWELQFHVLVESTMIVPTVWPKVVPVERYGEKVAFWPVARKVRGKATPGVHLAWQLQQEAVNDESGDDEDIDILDLEGMDQEGAEESAEVDFLMTEALDFLEREKRKREEHQIVGDDVFEAGMLDTQALVGQETPHDSVERLPAESMAAERPAATSQVAMSKPETSSGSGRAPPTHLVPKQRGLDGVWFGMGKITYYEKTGCFEAVCATHANCKLTRTSRGKPSRGGRPCAFLLAWLQFGQNVDTKEAHWNKSDWPERLNLETRQACRASIKELNAGLLLLEHERPLAEGEPEEQETLQGLLK
eukprot:2182108-Amphidinium_carterae.3